MVELISMKKNLAIALLTASTLFFMLAYQGNFDVCEQITKEKNLEIEELKSKENTTILSDLDGNGLMDEISIRDDISEIGKKVVSLHVNDQSFNQYMIDQGTFEQVQ
jgi:hypothetical protein